MSNLTAVVGPSPGPGHGEAFIWKRGADAPVVSVDAGGARRVGVHAASHLPEVLVLSHDDNDHTRGAVALMQAAGASLKQLWVPCEWAILIDQVARTTPQELVPEGTEWIDVRGVASLVAERLVGATEGSESVTLDHLTRAQENLDSWNVDALDADDGFTFVNDPAPKRGWYGAKDLGEIVRRVRFRATHLISILKTALTLGVHVRYFSIDVAIGRTGHPWDTEGMPGIATIANADETSHSLAVTIPAGLPFSFALTKITVQNRRALCTLLWTQDHSSAQGVMIWSDTDGGWMDLLDKPKLALRI